MSFNIKSPLQKQVTPFFVIEIRPNTMFYWPRYTSVVLHILFYLFDCTDTDVVVNMLFKYTDVLYLLLSLSVV